MNAREERAASVICGILISPVLLYVFYCIAVGFAATAEGLYKLFT